MFYSLIFMRDFNRKNEGIFLFFLDDHSVFSPVYLRAPFGVSTIDFIEIYMRVNIILDCAVFLSTEMGPSEPKCRLSRANRNSTTTIWVSIKLIHSLMIRLQGKTWSESPLAIYRLGRMKTQQGGS